MNKFAVRFLTLAIIICSGHIFLSSSPELQNNKQIELEKILKKCREYCERLTSVHLSFACKEKIKEEIFWSQPDAGRILISPEDKQFRKNEKNVYVYDYHLTLKDKEIKESRTLLEENGAKRYENEAKLKTKMFENKHLILEPISLFGEDEKHGYDYKIIKQEMLRGEKVIVIGVTPKSAEELNLISGRFWVNANDFGIIKIEWHQKVLRGFEGVERTREGFILKPDIVFITEFGFEKNGIRFPSRHSIKESYNGPDSYTLNPSSPSGGTKTGTMRFKRSDTTVIYEEYKFFAFETETIL